MKIQCDVCDNDEASVFCVADEAALCAACDHRVHHANKLAGKHNRFSLHHPKQVPICDICQERRAFLFCQQDRAILCKECDISIHKANAHTQKHTRFLLTGVKVSATSTLYSDAPSSSESPAIAQKVSDSDPKAKSKESRNKPAFAGPNPGKPFTAKRTTVQTTPVVAPEFCDKSHGNLMSGGNLNGSISTSSISEYLVETLPGWHVEDFLDPSPLPYGLCKTGENDVLPFLDTDFEGSMCSFPVQKMGFWVPQVPQSLLQTQPQSYQSIDISFGVANGNGLKEQTMEFTKHNIKSSTRWSDDNSFAVPQISPPSNTSKRHRTYC
ncbi:B-box zinc finger protein 21 [Dorcoceras hygrometricum]|uniref:B-box zinc finger protein 21 n=1 Tax=Dorcoceras hygrometricum TaxID=472368 RepID=A0A2Z7AM18_9LAMI|nr:B-box zinc finger protein 21 [Dorcoceras hygrometricum]